MELSFDGIGQVAATFQTEAQEAEDTAKLSTGHVVALTAANTVGFGHRRGSPLRCGFGVGGGPDRRGTGGGLCTSELFRSSGTRRGLDQPGGGRKRGRTDCQHRRTQRSGRPGG